MPYLIGAAALALAGAVLALVLLLPKCSEKNASVSNETPAPANTASATEAPSVTDTPAPTEAPAPTDTPAPTETPAPTDTPAPTATPAPLSSEPIRISDETSSVLVMAEALTRYDSKGRAHVVFTGSMAIGYLNNTDRVLYSAGFKTENIEAVSVTLNGALANTAETEEGFTVPFLNELAIGAQCEIFIEFTADIPLDGSITLLELDYDSAFTLTAYFKSDIPLTFVGCRSTREKSGRTYTETAERETAHSFGITIG